MEFIAGGNFSRLPQISAGALLSGYMSQGLELARKYHRDLPARIREYLTQERGIREEVIEFHLLGSNGNRITVPIFDRDGTLTFFKLARDPQDTTGSPKMVVYPPGAKMELYGWEQVKRRPEALIICEGEFDRLVLESQGFGAVTSTGGAGTFRRVWAQELKGIPCIYICFDQDEAGRRGVERVAQLLPQARVVRLPEEVGEGGDVTDFFVRLGRSRQEFVALLEEAKPLPQPTDTNRPRVREFRPRSQPNSEVAQLKSLVRLEEIVGRYLPLHRSGENFTARCPFHEDHNPSFVVFPTTQSFYCFGCQARGDVLTFFMRIENLSFPEALQVLRELAPHHAGRDPQRS